ncbi:hypothetical protein [Nocardia sp. NPDC049707]|uniref:hypothetical protein n=1 Tax=Nocardia sp. NPDC049707 TaxID=3154735 RepID=UPI0034370D1D
MGAAQPAFRRPGQHQTSVVGIIGSTEDANHGVDRARFDAGIPNGKVGGAQRQSSHISGI